MDITVIQIPTCTSGGRMEELRGGDQRGERGKEEKGRWWGGEGERKRKGGER